MNGKVTAQQQWCTKHKLNMKKARLPKSQVTMLLHQQSNTKILHMTYPPESTTRIAVCRSGCPTVWTNLSRKHPSSLLHRCLSFLQENQVILGTIKETNAFLFFVENCSCYVSKKGRIMNQQKIEEWFHCSFRRWKQTNNNNEIQ